MNLLFNIVYTPGTVRYLTLFVHSMLKWSDCAFRLVANGCLPPERTYLRRFCEQSDRLTFWTIPAKGALPHDAALNYLQGLTDADHFCFMDSDILAVDAFMPPVVSGLTTHAAVFSGETLWLNKTDATMPAAFRIMSGLHHFSDSGMCLGSSYFAVYDNRILTDFIQDTGIGFDTFRWSEIPGAYQDQLQDMGLKKDSYDTGKVLNLLLQHRGHACLHSDIPELCHLGGVSFVPSYETAVRSRKSRLADRFAVGPLKTGWTAYRRKSAYKAYEHLPAAEYKAVVSQRRDRRDPVRRYFFQLLRALFEDKSPPERPVLGDAEIDGRIEQATMQINALYQEYGQRL